MTTNSHIEVSKIDTFTKNKFNISSDEEMERFQEWLDNQPAKILFVQDALKAYRNPEVLPLTVKIEAKKTYTKDDFKSRQQLNSFLRRNGYTWHQVAPMNENEESTYGESFRWQLFSSDNKVLTVNEALAAI